MGRLFPGRHHHASRSPRSSLTLSDACRVKTEDQATKPWSGIGHEIR